MGVLVAVAFAIVAAAGCGEADLEMPPWIPIEDIEGPLRPEVTQFTSRALIDGDLRVMTYNVRHGIEVELLAQRILDDPDLAAVDVLILEETEHDFGRIDSDAAQLAALLGMGVAYAPIYVGPGGTSGLAILARAPMSDLEVMELPAPIDVGLLSSVHGVLGATLETGRGPVRVIAVHLDVPLNISQRILQLRPAVLTAKAPVIVGGDFNTNDYVWVANTIPLLTIDAAADAGQAPQLDRYMRGIGYDTPTAQLGTTWHGDSEHQRLDSIFTRGFTAGARAVERSINLSDHWPMWVDLAMPSSE